MVRGSKDALCHELYQYLASASEFAGPSRVILRGGWGGEDQETLMTHDCKFEGSSSGQNFCTYLVPNTSWEFGNYNVARVAQCLMPGDAKNRLVDANESNSDVNVTSIINAGSPVKLSVGYAALGEHRLSVLTLQVEPADAQ